MKSRPSSGRSAIPSRHWHRQRSGSRLQTWPWLRRKRRAPRRSGRRRLSMRRPKLCEPPARRPPCASRRLRKDSVSLPLAPLRGGLRRRNGPNGSASGRRPREIRTPGGALLKLLLGAGPWLTRLAKLVQVTVDAVAPPGAAEAGEGRCRPGGGARRNGPAGGWTPPACPGRPPDRRKRRPRPRIIRLATRPDRLLV